jgi:putative dehydrogenase
MNDTSSSNSKIPHIAVIGIGAMGGGMARALLDSNVSHRVDAYDRALPLVEAFYRDAQKLGKAATDGHSPTKLSQVVTKETSLVLVVLQNEAQCEQVCFGTGSPQANDENDNLRSLLSHGSCVIVSSTVTATWIRQACTKFREAGILCVDCPVSGGPVRARDGQLTLMASGDDDSLAVARPLLDALASQVHVIDGGAGMGSTVKMVHQLLAGVHVVVAAEALALAAKAGLDVVQVYEIVNGAAGASWMFRDRGERMIAAGDGDVPVNSQAQIFVKDLDIVHAEAKKLQSPIPIASAALQQFISAQSLGLSERDDSQVVKVYENVTGVPVGQPSTRSTRTPTGSTSNTKAQAEGNLVGDLWMGETILEVGDEPRHTVVLSNAFVRAIRVSFPPKDTTLAHRHAEDSLYFFLVEGGLEVVNHVQGSDPACDCMEFGEIRFGTHKQDQPLVHRSTNQTGQQMLCIDAEVLATPPITAAIPLVAQHHELVKTRDKCRVYKLSLEAGESTTVSYPFFHLIVVVSKTGLIQKETLSGRGNMQWTESSERGDVAWKEPTAEIKKTNTGQSTYVEYIAEWR